jgi:hypothetical protein
MTPQGCDRVCARCDKVIHDLSLRTIDEVETLLRDNPDSCVRARVTADGEVVVKKERSGRALRMMVAMGASATLVAGATPALARDKGPPGAISGSLVANDFPIRVTATSADGKSYRVKANSKRRYRIRHLPAGTYTLTIAPSCGDSWTVENVVVRDSETVVPTTVNPAGCITIGLLRIEGNQG